MLNILRTWAGAVQGGYCWWERRTLLLGNVQGNTAGARETAQAGAQSARSAAQGRGGYCVRPPLLRQKWLREGDALCCQCVRLLHFRDGCGQHVRRQSM